MLCNDSDGGESKSNCFYDIMRGARVGSIDAWTLMSRLRVRGLNGCYEGERSNL